MHERCRLCEGTGLVALHAVGRRSASPGTENQHRAFAAGHDRGHRPPVGVCSQHQGDMGLSTYRQLIIPLTNTRGFLTLPPVADVGTSDDSASELVGTHALRRGLRCCLSLWRPPARCARVPPRVETDMKAALGVIAVAVVLTSGCAQKDWIDRTVVTVDVTGVWEGRLIMPEASWSGDFVCDRPIATEASPSGNVALVLQQQGAKVTSNSRVQR